MVRAAFLYPEEGQKTRGRVYVYDNATVALRGAVRVRCPIISTYRTPDQPLLRWTSPGVSGRSPVSPVEP